MGNSSLEIKNDLDVLAQNYHHLVKLSGGDMILPIPDALTMLDRLTAIGVKVDSLGAWRYADHGVSDIDSIIEIPHIFCDVPSEITDPYESNKRIRQFIQDACLNNLAHQVDLVDLSITPLAVFDYLYSQLQAIK